jgi:hypothetical protein
MSVAGPPPPAKKKAAQKAARKTWQHRKSGAHDPASGRAVLDQALAAGALRGAFLGGGHPAASADFSHNGSLVGGF